MRSALPFLVAIVAVACSSSGPVATDGGADAADAGGIPPRAPAILPPLGAAVKGTDGATIHPTHAVLVPKDKRSPADPASLDVLIAEGFGKYTLEAGEAALDRTPDGMPAPAAGPNRKRLVRFAHLCDFQLADDESPARLARFDGDPPLEAAFRPQEGHECRIVNAVVRTVNRVHKDTPLDFVLLGGDNADNAQQNELDWVLAILDGSSAPIACDSGDPDDPVPGADNDGKDPFVPAGLDVPWYWVSGNHDVLAQGNYPTDAYRNSQAVGTAAIGGTRDYRMRGAITSGEVIPDPKRALLSRADIVSRVVASAGKAGPTAHGLGAYAMQTKKAYYTADLPGGLRLLAMDTAAETGASEGVLRRGDLEGFVKPELARAKSDGKLVIVASHHAAGSLGDGTGLGGTKQADAVPQQEWEQVLVAAPHVIAHIAGHSHEHRIRFVGTPNVAGYWEVKTSAIADYPHQFRNIEIWDEDNGQLSIRAIDVDYATDGDAVAATGRTLGLVDWTSGWVSGDRLGTPGDRNVTLWLKKP